MTTPLLQARLCHVVEQVGEDVAVRVHPRGEERRDDTVQERSLARVLNHELLVECGPVVRRLRREGLRRR